MGPVVVVWLKRDLRVHDHDALVAGAASGLPLVALYVFEPELLLADESDAGRWGFVIETLVELEGTLHGLGGRLTVRRGSMPDVLDELHHQLEPLGGIVHLHSHQETGNAIVRERDRRVLRWARQHGVPWTEHHQDGVVRRLASRDGWHRRWLERMRRPLEEPPTLRSLPDSAFDHGRLPALAELGLRDSPVVDRQAGGESCARELLDSFLNVWGERYQSSMSSPLQGRDTCSRLSPHLATGALSLRSAHHALFARQAELREMAPAERGLWGTSMRSFAGRLRWHCHFMQKLEDDPRIEFENSNRVYDGMRDDQPDHERLHAWWDGSTGYPMVDASIRCLRMTGWLNFRLRAMLVSFAAYHLWLHWRPVGLLLARALVDFEPGIHWSQMQMQSGVAGGNPVRMHSPTRQFSDYDRNGDFVRRWLPELSRVPTDKLAEPRRMTRAEQRRAGCRIGYDYPRPIVEDDEAVARAKQRNLEVQAKRGAGDGAARVPRRRSERGAEDGA